MSPRPGQGRPWRRGAARDDGPRASAGKPDQRLHQLCGLRRPGSQEGRRDRRKAGFGGGLARDPWFSEAERAALGLAEAMTRLCDRPDPVPDDLWASAEKHFDERQLAGLVLWIATSNLFNRINVTTRQAAGARRD